MIKATRKDCVKEKFALVRKGGGGCSKDINETISQAIRMTTALGCWTKTTELMLKEIENITRYTIAKASANNSKWYVAK